jgi:hypothetical protein
MHTSFVAPEPGPVDGVDNLPIPSGTNASAKRQREVESEATPGAMGNPMTYKDYTRDCQGDNPKIADGIDFATGKDVRSYDGAGSARGSDATPAMPGANV